MNDGGSAFPFVSESVGSPGMSLRDYFAGMAMQVFGLENMDFGTVGKPQNPWPWVAEECYRAADAMLAERVKQ